MNDKLKLILMSVIGIAASGGLAWIMFFAAFTHQSAVDVVTGKNQATEDLIPSTGDVAPKDFDAPVTLAPSDGRSGEGTVQFVDGLLLTLTRITRVPCVDGATKCAWTDEYKADFSLTYGGASAAPGTAATASVSQRSAPKAASGPYEIELKAVSADSATFAVHAAPK